MPESKYLFRPFSKLEQAQDCPPVAQNTYCKGRSRPAEPVQGWRMNAWKSHVALWWHKQEWRVGFVFVFFLEWLRKC